VQERCAQRLRYQENRRDCLAVARSATNDSARDVRAADLQEEVVKPTRERSGSATQRGSPDPTKTAATNEHRSERSEQSNTAPVRERSTKKMGEAPVKYELTGAS
jgi:hypothetical protein